MKGQRWEWIFSKVFSDCQTCRNQQTVNRQLDPLCACPDEKNTIKRSAFQDRPVDKFSLFAKWSTLVWSLCRSIKIIHVCVCKWNRSKWSRLTVVQTFVTLLTLPRHFFHPLNVKLVYLAGKLEAEFPRVAATFLLAKPFSLAISAQQKKKTLCRFSLSPFSPCVDFRPCWSKKQKRSTNL